jgi:LysM repeat protein
MKTQKIDRTSAKAIHIHRPSWTRLIVLVVVLGLLLSFVEPAKATATAPVDSPTASYGCSGAYYRVRSGDTIYSFAARYGSTAYRIASCNGLRSYTVRVGQSLLVPVAGRGKSGWIEGIDFVRNANSPMPTMVAGDSIPLTFNPE